jgi:hypothetical protein
VAGLGARRQRQRRFRCAGATDKGQLTFNGLPQVKHIAMMATWTKANYFKLFGRRNEASAKFHEGECAMITTDSREHIDFRDAKGVELGVAPLPYHDDVYGGRQSSLADGASLWVGAGYSAAEYKQAAKFVSFLLSPEMQVEMVRMLWRSAADLGCPPAARSKMLQDGDKTLDIAYASLSGNGSKPAVRVANIDAVRIIADEELEAVWADKKPAKAALDASVSRGNALLGCQAGPEEGAALLMKLPLPRWIAHRGGGSLAPENTWLASGWRPGWATKPSSSTSCCRAMARRFYSRRNAGADDQWRMAVSAKHRMPFFFRLMPANGERIPHFAEAAAVPQSRLAGQCRDQAGARLRGGYR